MIINRVSNFLEQEVLTSLREKFEKSKGTPSFEVNNMGRWGAGLEAGSYSPVLILPLEEYRQYFIDKYCDILPMVKLALGYNCHWKNIDNISLTNIVH